MKELFSGLTIIVLVFLVIVLWPLAIIWSLNTLFTLAIAYTFWTWLAVVVLTSVFGTSQIKNKK
jgi:hypothetical protein